MKKFINIFFICLCILIPSVLFVGCGSDKNSAEAVKNKIFYVSNAKQGTTDLTTEYTDAPLKIIFHDSYFMVEYSTQKNVEEYGYYLGTFSTDENKVIFNITEFGGTYQNYVNNPKKEISVFSTLTYNSGKLETSFAKHGTILSFTFETK